MFVGECVMHVCVCVRVFESSRVRVCVNVGACFSGCVCMGACVVQVCVCVCVCCRAYVFLCGCVYGSVYMGACVLVGVYGCLLA